MTAARNRPPVAPFPAVDETAHCLLPGVDWRRFHPAKGANGHTVDTTKKLCTGGGKVPPCPFLDGCREYGITHRVHGIWGGLADDGRKAERKARRIVPVPIMSSAEWMRPGPKPEEMPPGGFARVPCEVCGVELLPKSLPAHRKRFHFGASELGSQVAS